MRNEGVGPQSSSIVEQEPMDMTSMDHAAMLEWVDGMWEASLLPSLEDYIRIPAQSPAFDADWAETGDLDRSIDHLVGWLDGLGLAGYSHIVHRLEGRTPLLLVTIEGTAPGEVLCYSHLDKQPPLTDLWSEGLHPFEPVRRGEFLYGRGSVDDGYGNYLCALSVAALQESGIDHPTIRLLIETCEESGSPDLPAYLEALEADLGSPDLIVVLDSGAGDYERLWITESLRGLLHGTLTVSVSREGVHSGLSGGIIPETFRIARRQLEKIEDSRTGEVLLDALKIDISDELRERCGRIVDVLGDSVWSEYPLLDGVSPQVTDPVEVLLNGNWRPCVAIIGAEGLPSLAEAGNVLRPTTRLKVSVRIPPGVDADAAAEALKKALESDPPHGAHISFEADPGAPGFHSPPLDGAVGDALQTAAQALHGYDPMPLYEGGTIPFLAMMQQGYPDARFFVVGSMGPDGNAHGPDEKLHIPASKKLTVCVAAAIAAIGS